jgi:3-oxoacyl-[acyl-carrier protein] reductase
MEEVSKEKVALVTGSGRGIGKAIALKLASAGADVVVCDIDGDSAVSTSNQIKEMGRKSEAYKVDVTDFEGVADMMNKVLENFENVDILVNNAGITRDKNIFLMAKEEWDSVIGINLTGYFNVTRNIIMPMLKNKNGSILNIASVSGLIGLPGQANYCSSKHGVIGFTRSISKECGRAKVTVNCIAPGFIETEMTEKLGEDRIKEIKKTIPVRRFGTVDEVAELSLFLVSDKARYITGQCFTIDGGLTS